MKKALTIGEALYGLASDQVDVSLEHVTSFTRYLAGAEINIAIGMNRLDIPTEYVTRFGDDVFGQYIKENLESNRVGSKYMSVSNEYMSAFQLKSKVSSGDPVFGYFRKGSAASNFPLEMIDEIDFSEIDLVHVTGVFVSLSEKTLAAANYLIDKAKEHNCLISFDPNLRPQLWKDEETMVKEINHLAAKANIVLPGISEAKILTGTDKPKEIAKFYHQLGVETVIVKVGPKGAYAARKNFGTYVSGFIVNKVVDTVGAGDGFAVGVLSGILKELSLEEAVLRGNAIGALAVQTLGDNDGYPNEEQLQQYIATAKRVGIEELL